MGRIAVMIGAILTIHTSTVFALNQWSVQAFLDSWDEVRQLYYVTAIRDDMLSNATSVVKGTQYRVIPGWMEKCLSETTNGQVLAAVRNFFNAHPEIWGYPLAVAVNNAIVDFCRMVTPELYPK